MNREKFAAGNFKEVFQDPDHNDRLIKQENLRVGETERLIAQFEFTNLLHDLLPQNIPEIHGYQQALDLESGEAKDVWVVSKAPLDTRHRQIQNMRNQTVLSGEEKQRLAYHRAEHHRELIRLPVYHELVQTLSGLGVRVDTTQSINFSIGNGGKSVVYLDDIDAFTVRKVSRGEEGDETIVVPNYFPAAVRDYIATHVPLEEEKGNLLSRFSYIEDLLISYAQSHNYPIGT